MSKNSLPNYFPEQRADDESIGILVDLLDAFDYESHGLVKGYNRERGSGMVRAGEMACFVWQSSTYRELDFRRQPDWDMAKFIQIDRHIGVLEEGGAVEVLQAPGSKLPETDKEMHQLLDEVNAEMAPTTEEISEEDAKYFAEKYPHFWVYSGMALKDVILGEYELGKPVFYSLLSRPELGTIQDMTACFRDGEIIHGNGVDGQAEVENFLLKNPKY